MTDAAQSRTLGATPEADGAPSVPSILAITSHRPAEITTTLSELELPTTVLELDADSPPLVRALAAARRTWSALDRCDPDLVLLDCFETLGAPATWVATRRNVPVVARLVGDHWRKIDEERLEPARADRDVPAYVGHRVSRALNRYVFDRASGFVTVSTDLRNTVLQRTDCPPERVGVIPVPITRNTGDTGSAAAAAEAFGIETDRLLLTVTNLTFRAKLDGVSTVVSEVLPLLRADGDLAYLVAGGGQHHEALVSELDDRIEEPSVRRRVHAPGYVERVADLYALADVFVYVSYLDGYPNVVLEAQTAGIPVVANDAFGMRDQITDGETGLLVDPDRPGAVRSAVDHLFEHPTDRRRLGEGGRRRALRENTPAAVAGRLGTFLEGFQRGPPARP